LKKKFSRNFHLTKRNTPERNTSPKLKEKQNPQVTLQHAKTSVQVEAPQQQMIKNPSALMLLAASLEETVLETAFESISPLNTAREEVEEQIEEQIEKQIEQQIEKQIEKQIEEQIEKQIEQHEGAISDRKEDQISVSDNSCDNFLHTVTVCRNWALYIVYCTFVHCVQDDS
jgi:hypothetical protein